MKPAFLKQIRLSPSYRSLDIDLELKKMEGWLIPRPHRQMCDSFVINWLNKALEKKTEELEPLTPLQEKAVKAFDILWGMIQRGVKKLPENVSKEGLGAVRACGGIIRMGATKEVDVTKVKKRFVKEYLKQYYKGE